MSGYRQPTTAELEAMDEAYYEPSATMEKYDPRARSFYNALGQRLRDPRD